MPIDIQTFTADGTWNKPSGAIEVQVICIGGGGGGGGGARRSSGTLSNGGKGGGGAGIAYGKFAAGDLGATVAVDIGNGGSGGTGATADNTNGGLAGTAQATTFGAHLTASAGAQGTGGGTTFNNDESDRTLGGAGNLLRGGKGGTNSTTASLRDGVNKQIIGPSGGGAGGHVTTAPANVNGGDGGDTKSLDFNISAYQTWWPGFIDVAGGAAGSPGSTGNSGTTDTGNSTGGSGGGGGNAPGGNGGVGGNYGGGGGGGAGALNGTNGGNGGAGAPGFCIVITTTS